MSYICLSYLLVVGGFSPTHLKHMLVKFVHFARDPGEQSEIFELPPPRYLYPIFQVQVSGESDFFGGQLSRQKGQFVSAWFSAGTNSNWPLLKMDGWKTSFPLGWPIFRGHMNFWGSMYISLNPHLFEPMIVH